jgi:hypothetical protein
MDGDSIDFGLVLEMCQNKERRVVLRLLVKEQQSLTLDNLTKAIFNSTHQMSPAGASEDKLSDIRLSLYHVHLPKLASKDFIHYDSEKELVAPTNQFEQLQPTLSTILDADPSLEMPITP